MSAGHGGDHGGLPEEHEEHVNHEAWVIPYADLLTLLMAMFIALFAMSSVDIEKFKELALSFNREFGGDELDTGVFAEQPGTGPLEGQGTGMSQQAGGAVGPDRQPVSDSVVEGLLQFKTDLEAARSAERAALEEVRQHIEAQAEAQGLVGFLDLRLEERGLVVTVVTDQVLFESGSAALQPTGAAILRLVGDALAGLENPLLVEGHTDDVPIATAQYPSNWELSTARAGSVVRFFEREVGIEPARMTAAGYADLRPVADNSTEEGRAANRRVELVVQATADADALAALREAGTLADAVPDLGVGGAAAPDGIEAVGDPIPDVVPH